MSEVAQWIMIGIATAFVAIERALKIYSNMTWKKNGTERRKNTNNPGIEHTPGAALICQENGKALSGIKNELVNIRRRLAKLER